MKDTIAEYIGTIIVAIVGLAAVGGISQLFQYIVSHIG